VTLVAPISGDDDMLAITSGDGKLTFQGTYDPYTRDYEDHSLLFLGGSNTLYHPNGAGDLTIGPFRAYFQLHGVQMTTDSGGSGSDDDDYIAEGGGGARAIVVSILDNEAAGITPLAPSSPHTSVPGDLDETWYTLDGRLLDSQPTTPGIYIHSSSGNKRRKVSL
jgi:hypothetical protein